MAYKFTNNETDSQDLIQDTLHRAIKNLDKFQPGTNLNAWLFAILRNTGRSQKRKQAREVEDVDGGHAERLSVSGAQESRIACIELREALELLPADQKDAVVLVCAGGMTYEEASKITGATVGALKTRVSRGRARLMELTDPPMSRLST